MIPIEIIAVGRMKQAAYLDLCQHYMKQFTSSFHIIEIEAHNTTEEHQKIIKKLDPAAAIFILDERGKSLKSTALSQKIDSLSSKKLQCVIGGADGLNDTIRARADLLLSFGQQTWPHMLARVMLIEQLYRSQQILAGHPYHRE